MWAIFPKRKTLDKKSFWIKSANRLTISKTYLQIHLQSSILIKMKPKSCKLRTKILLSLREHSVIYPKHRKRKLTEIWTKWLCLTLAATTTKVNWIQITQPSLNKLQLQALIMSFLPQVQIIFRCHLLLFQT